MSSGSVVGLCRMIVPAIEKMITRMIRITPVLTELRVCQVLRTAEPREKAITFVFLASCNARSAPSQAQTLNLFQFSLLAAVSTIPCGSGLRHNTQVDSCDL